MFIQLKKEREYRGKKHPEGACLEVGDHIGGQMLLNSIATQTTRDNVEAYAKKLKMQEEEHAKQLEAIRSKFEDLKEKERLKLGEQHNIEGFKDLSENEQIQKLVDLAMSLGDEL